MIDALLIVGHQPWAKGAANMGAPDPADDVYEFDFNMPLVMAVHTGLIAFGVTAEADFYTPAGGNVARWSGASRLLVEFHCNAFNGSASGSETLYAQGSNEGFRAAECVQEQVVQELGLPDRGCKAIRPDRDADGRWRHRGAYLIHGVSQVALIPEPFFIDNDKDLKRAQDADLVGAYTRGIMAALGAI